MNLHKLLALIREEARYYFTRWQFYFSTGLILILFLSISAATAFQQTIEQSPLADVESIFDISSAETFSEPVGYVDLAGIMQVIPPQQAQEMIAYPNQQAAASALQAGDIESYYVISADYIATGGVEQFALTPALLSAENQIFTRLLNYNVLLLSGDPQLSTRIQNPVLMDYRGPELASFAPIHPDIDQNDLTAAITLLGFFAFLLFSNFSYLQRPFEREVEAKVTEVITTSVTGLEYILGKIFGLGTIMLTQTSLWLGLNALIFGVNRFALDVELVAWPLLLVSLVYGLLGYLLLSGLFLTMLSLLPSYINPNQLNFLMLALFIVPAVGLLFIITNPQSATAVGLSIFPLTAPFLMPLRLIVAPVPIWQSLASFGLLLVSTYAALQLSAYTFKKRAPHMRQ